MYRIDREPTATVGLVERALREVDVEEVYVEGNVVMGTIEMPGSRPATLWIIEVDVGAPPDGGGTYVSVAVRLNDELQHGDLPEIGGKSAPQVGQRVVGALRSAAGEDFYRVPGPGEGSPGSVDGWESIADSEGVTRTGMRSLGQDVYEVATEGRIATVALVRPERHDAGRAVAVSTPLEVTQVGSGFECYYDADDEFTRYDYGDQRVDLPDDSWREVRSLTPFGLFTVDDRLGVAQHVLPRVVTDGAVLLEHARTVVSVAGAVERAVEARV